VTATTTTGQPVEVHCVEGCDGGGVDGYNLAGLGIAPLSLVIAVVALRIAFRGLGIARAEHAVRTKERSARGDLEPTLRVVAPGTDEEGVIESPPMRLTVRVEAGITSVGDKPAEHVGINLLLPLRAEEPIWTDPQGRPTRDGALNTTSEVLTDQDGKQHPVHYLDKTVSRIGPEARVAYVTFHVASSPKAGQELRIPIKFKVWCDDMPEGVDERVTQVDVVVRGK
jgi:hypothetical protein